MMRTRHLFAGLLVLALAACATGASPSPSVAPSPQPSVATPPSPTPTPTTSTLNVKVTFDGETCTYFGPTVIVDGTVMRFEYAPDQAVADSYLMVYGVRQGTTFQDLVDAITAADASGDHDVSVNIPEWVYQMTNTSLHGAGSMLYTIESVKNGSDAVDYAVGGYQVMCATPDGFPAVQLSVAGP